MNNCPKRAIETAHGYITAAMFLINLVILVLFWRWVSSLVTLPADKGWLKIPFTFARWGVTFAGLIVTYRVYHYLLKIPLVRELFYYTSLTRFRFWRRYRPSKKMISELH